MFLLHLLDMIAFVLAAPFMIVIVIVTNFYGYLRNAYLIAKDYRK